MKSIELPTLESFSPHIRIGSDGRLYVDLTAVEKLVPFLAKKMFYGFNGIPHREINAARGALPVGIGVHKIHRQMAIDLGLEIPKLEVYVSSYYDAEGKRRDKPEIIGLDEIIDDIPETEHSALVDEVFDSGDTGHVTIERIHEKIRYVVRPCSLFSKSSKLAQGHKKMLDYIIALYDVAMWIVFPHEMADFKGTSDFKRSIGIRGPEHENIMFKKHILRYPRSQIEEDPEKFFLNALSLACQYLNQNGVPNGVYMIWDEQSFLNSNLNDSILALLVHELSRVWNRVLAVRENLETGKQYSESIDANVLPFGLAKIRDGKIVGIKPKPGDRIVIVGNTLPEGYTPRDYEKLFGPGVTLDYLSLDGNPLFRENSICAYK